MRDSQQQLAADLRWAMECPSLIDSARCEILETTTLAHSLRLDQIPPPTNHKVGAYFESLIQFWLTQICQFDLVAAGRQIVIDGRTVGEIDFLYRDDTGELIHLETAVKFYLAHRVPGRCSLIGPNANDDFAAKLDRMCDHQLPLSERYLPKVVRRVALVKGVIFYRSNDGALVMPDGLSNRHRRGIWIYENEMDRLRHQLEAIADPRSWSFSLMRKPYWLSCIPELTEVMGLDELQARIATHFLSSESPLMVSCRLAHGTTETHRLMVVSHQWPQC